MELRELRIFLEAAQCGCMSKAAERLYISRSGVSRAVSALERDLQVILVNRQSNKTLGLTPAGRQLAHEAAELLRAAEEAAKRVRSAADQVQ